MNSETNRMADQDFETRTRFAEAARYALMRRLAPVIRHNMAGSLQPIAMVAGMLERRLQKPDSDPEALLKNARDIVALSKEAAASCVDLMSWFAPKDDPLVAVGTGITQCLAMVATELSFKGFSIENRAEQADGQLPLSALRNAFTAAVLALTDAAAAPRNILVEAEPSGDGLSIRITLKNTLAAASMPAGKPYRKIGWGDVEALAGESARLSHTEDEAVLHFQSAVEAAESSRKDLMTAGQA
ncbi:hypothetical protein SAMN05216350_10250 [Polaromonas sp. YR568]|uniref:hypothetical protein n=1 Tax=Polaromonas sp. YR568 TaxID=1855301 RepID=UPI0008ECC160|nr:hypothetical protein [Polaromonas sp. YR568]SFU47368.1 hypothetical protein SAMN05216350_10250 [Polaromonas sp. YR568]